MFVFICADIFEDFKDTWSVIFPGHVHAKTFEHQEDKAVFVKDPFDLRK